MFESIQNKIKLPDLPGGYDRKKSVVRNKRKAGNQRQETVNFSLFDNTNSITNE